ncbi:Signal transduction histidine-protein kinase BarA [Thalassoglobus polymorphus]|uniref:histidine kinase n=2 Tax=Thalassoglobus polymorphus TaxID=2527994 RepID=A0A517QUM4_9PLAN|nr:Signal transduction histidine-protein kinase BarA [Thalassoglobus polymorphus]
MFGGALMLLITGSFYVYAQLNLRIVREQYRDRAQLLIAQNMMTTHWKASQNPNESELIVIPENLNEALKPDRLREFNWKFMPEDYENASTTARPVETFEIEAFRDLLSKKEPYVIHEDTERGRYLYFEPIIATELCLQCHRDRHSPLVSETNQIMGMARITFELRETQHDIARNNAILIVMAIVTAVLGMGVAYVIVRYVIVKPIMHLKDVSDAIAQGELDQRADIRTGDEFQELSHAFNRMLRHLVTTQEELKQSAASLDYKVDELAQANLSLHEMNKIKNEFLATMSHELRTPLNSILGFSDVLAVAENLNEKQKKYLSNIQTSGNNLLLLINDILDLAKIDAGRMEVHISEFSIADLIEQLALSVKPLAEKKNIDMDWEVSESVPVLVQDVGKMQQILYNLLSNAIKFTPEGGRIRIDVSMHDETLFDLVVADTGIGIPLEDQSIIFEKFRQGQNLAGSDSMTREYEGTGLGLSIIKELCRLLGGEVSLESEFGKGSTFTVRLPVELACQNPLESADSFTSTPAELMKGSSSLGSFSSAD